MIPFSYFLFSFPAQAEALSYSRAAGAFHVTMELIRKNDCVLAGARDTDRASNGGYSHVSKGP